MTDADDGDNEIVMMTTKSDYDEKIVLMKIMSIKY